jgi:hypothetical protein
MAENLASRSLSPGQIMSMYETVLNAKTQMREFALQAPTRFELRRQEEAVRESAIQAIAEQSGGTITAEFLKTNGVMKGLMP